MRLLVDTCALVWFLRGDEDEMPGSVFEMIESEANDVYVSVVSIWEMAIKASLGKLALPAGLDGSFEQDLVREGFLILGLEFAHAAEVYRLPWGHRDPFDRLLIAQCRCENLSPVTPDAPWRAPGYGIQVLWAEGRG
jgi:PIN domain nuclease of toxin-antitoxin system